MAQKKSSQPAGKQQNPLLVITGLGAAIGGLFLFGRKAGAQETQLEVVGNPTIL